MSFPTLRVSIRSWAFISIPIILGVKLDVNWCSDKLVNKLSLHCIFHLILNGFDDACTLITQ